MRLVLLVLVLAAFATDAGPGFGVGGGLSTCPKGYIGGGLTPCTLAPSYAFFEFAPSSGAGMGAACACTAVTGAKGESMTFTRASVGSCLKGNTTTAANGDMVMCSSGQPRVMPGGDGSGGLGLLVESARTNSIARSQELENPYWNIATTAGPITITQDQAVAPDGTTTADRVVVSACPTNGTLSVFYGSLLGISTKAAGTVWLKGNGGSGSVGLALGQGAFTGATCSFVSGAWTSCSVVDTRATINEFYVGCINNSGGVTPNPGNTGAADVFVWGVDVEAGEVATSYIPTVGAAVTRSAESVYSTVSAIGPTVSLAATVLWPSTSVGAVNFSAFGSGAGSNLTLYRTNDTAAGYQINGTTTSPSVASMGVAPHRSVLFDNAGTRGAIWDENVVAAPAASLPSTDTLVWVGSGASGGTPANGVVKLVCLDPNPLRCR